MGGNREWVSCLCDRWLAVVGFRLDIESPVWSNEASIIGPEVGGHRGTIHINELRHYVV